MADDVISVGEFEDLKRKVNHIEYEELKEIRNEVQDIREKTAKNNVLLEQNIKSSERLADTLDNVQETMRELSHNMKNNNGAIESLSNKVSNLDNKIENLDDKIDKVEQKSKIDIIDWVKKHWFPIVATCAVILYIYFNKTTF